MNALKDMLKSKKALVAIATAIVNLVVTLGVELSSTQQQTLISLTAVAIAYLIGQGIADAGKEAKKLELGTELEEFLDDDPKEEDEEE